MKKASWFPLKARFFRSNLDLSASAQRQAAGASVFPLRFLVRVAVLVALSGVCLAAGPRTQEGSMTTGSSERAITRGPAMPAQPEASGGTSSFTAIDVPGAGTGTHQGTVATAVNAAGDVAGIYIDSSGNEHAFVLPAGGTITPFNAAGSGGSKIFTIPVGFDTAGNIAGVYRDASNRVHGFVRAASTGAMTILDVPGEDTGNMEGTYPICINGSGEIAGDYSTTLATASGTNSFSHGFIRSASGTISTFDAAPIPSSYGSTNPGTYVVSINASGEVSGFYIDGIGAEHGFLRTASGAITTFEAPNAATGSEQGTAATGIDAAGDVIGAYLDANNIIHGFVRREATGTITPIDAPGAGTATYQGTYPDAIDAAGDISGSFTDANNVVHGFVLPANGAIVTYDAPGSSAAQAPLKGAGVKLNSKLSGLGKSLSPSVKPKRSNSPLGKFKSLLGRVGAVNGEGTGILNGNGANPSGTASYGNLLLNDVNASGEIVGLFTDGDYVFQAYLRAANGAITTIDAPNAGTAADQGTGGLAINTAGTIVGAYADTNSVLHGFVYNSAALTATTTTLKASQTATVFGEPASFDATVTAGSGSVPDGENVWFMNGSAQLGSEPLSGGKASFTTTELPVGADSITAVYGGDTNYSGSASTAVSQTVNKASSTTALTASPNPSSFGQLVTLTATVSGQFGGVATGTVTFSNGSTGLGTVALSGNAAVLTSTALPQGTDALTAVYNGDSNFAGSTSNTVSQVVTAALPSANEWTWISGSSTVTCNGDGCAQPGVYGTLGKAAAGNVPGGRQGAVTWTDKSGNLWLFGGVGFDVTSAAGSLNDLWEFNPSTNEWAWMSGSSTVGSNGGQSGVYGTMGTPAAGNVPGGRGEAVSWTDSSGHLWLFGGQGFDAAGRNVFLNDMWEFNISTLEWTWMGGSGTITCALPSPDYCGEPGVYGTQGTAAAGNIPGGRYSATAATDSSGHFWLFGGYGYGAGGACCYLNDLWEFNPATNMWTWVSGGSGGEQNGVYGTLGTPASGNVPGSRYYASSWMDSGGHLWLFGGYGFDANYTGGYLDDQWEFSPSANDWVWTGGSSAATCWASEACPQTAVYGTLGAAAAGNTPGDRSGANSWTDGSGNLWLFGNLVWHANGSGGYVFNYLNDLWEFNPSTKEWTWMGGSGTPNQRGVYGTLGTPAAGNVPGSRYFASNWIDNGGHLLVFGGFGYDANGTEGNLNDLWRYQPPTAAEPPAITTQPVSRTVTDGSTATFSVTATGTPTLTYQWQYLSGSTWKAFGAGTGYSTATLTTFATTVAYNGLQLRVVVTDGNGLTTTSNSVKLTVGPAITTQPVSQTVTDGSAAIFSVAAEGVPVLSYQWQYLSGSTWKAFGAGTGYTTATLTTFATTAAYNGLQLRVVVTDGNGLTATSNSVKLTVGPAITTQPVSQTVTDGNTAAFSVVAAGVPTLSYQWQYLSGTTWKAFGAGTGYTTANMTTFATTAAYNGLQFRVVVTDGNGLTATSSTVKLTVGPAITTQPLSQTVTAGSTASFSVAAAGVPTLTYQWQYLSGTTWKAFGAGTGYTTATLTTFATTAAYNGLQLRVVVTDGNGLTVTSQAALLTIE